MFKERRFLVGFGAGIIVGGLLLQLMITGQQGPMNKMNSDENSFVEQEVQQQGEAAAEEADDGKKDVPADSAEESAEGKAPAKPDQPDQPNQPSEPETDQPSEPAVPSGNENAEAPEEPVKPDAGQAGKPQQPNGPVSEQPEAPDAPDAVENAVPVIIRIEPGMNLTKAAKLLADNGIITSQSNFIAKMKSDKKLVRAGFFAFSGQPTLEETIKTLTGQPLTEAEADRIKSKS